MNTMDFASHLAVLTAAVHTQPAVQPPSPFRLDIQAPRIVLSSNDTILFSFQADDQTLLLHDDTLLARCALESTVKGLQADQYHEDDFALYHRYMDAFQ